MIVPKEKVLSFILNRLSPEFPTRYIQKFINRLQTHYKYKYNLYNYKINNILHTCTLTHTHTYKTGTNCYKSLNHLKLTIFLYYILSFYHSVRWFEIQYFLSEIFYLERNFYCSNVYPLIYIWRVWRLVKYY